MITGFYFDPSTGYHGFVRAATGKITKFDPRGSQKTTAVSINDAGAITGFYIALNGSTKGFMLANGAFTTFMVKGSTLTDPLSINTAGAITGWTRDTKSLIHGFVRDRYGYDH